MNGTAALISPQRTKNTAPANYPQKTITIPLRAEASKRIVSAGRTNRSVPSQKYLRGRTTGRTKPRTLRSASIARRLRAFRARREKEAK